MEGITTAISNLATSVSTGALGMLTSIVPLLAPIVGGVIVTKLGFRFIKRFSN